MNVCVKCNGNPCNSWDISLKTANAASCWRYWKKLGGFKNSGYQETMNIWTNLWKLWLPRGARSWIFAPKLMAIFPVFFKQCLQKCGNNGKVRGLPKSVGFILQGCVCTVALVKPALGDLSLYGSSHVGWLSVTILLLSSNLIQIIYVILNQKTIQRT